MKKTTLICLFSFFVLSRVFAQTPDIGFMQDDKMITIPVQKGGIYEINLKPKPFTILFRAKELNVCADLDETLFQKARPDTDINSDFNSPFFIFKYAAISENGGVLYLSQTGANSLNSSHGAKPFRDDLYQYPVQAIVAEKNRQVPVNNLKTLFLSLWLDKNRDQFIDPDELMQVKITIE